MRKVGVKKVIIILLVLLILAAVIAYNYWSVDAEISIDSGQLSQQEVYELTCRAVSEEQALQIAQDYGIELVSYSMYIAVFKTDKTYQEIQEYGVEHGLVELFINSTDKSFHGED